MLARAFFSGQWVAEVFSRSFVSSRCAFRRRGLGYFSGATRSNRWNNTAREKDRIMGHRQHAQRGWLFLLSAPSLLYEPDPIYALVPGMDGVWVGSPRAGFLTVLGALYF